MGYFRDQTWHVPKPKECDYGYQWPVGPRGEQTDQITRELYGFKANGRVSGFKSRYEHGLNLIQLLWPEEVTLWVDVKHYQTGEKVRVFNNFFLRAFEALCNGRRTAFTGCASSGKTFVTAVYVILCFLSDPENTTVLVSTTSASDAERRVWADIKVLHNALEQRYPIGTLIDYLKTITFDPGRELKGKNNVSERDLRNGISLIAMPEGSEGERAMGKIIGTKQKNGSIIWVKDELPHMIDGIDGPEANLEMGAVFFQAIGIGNANRKSDPHGSMCEPQGGWESGEASVDVEKWEGKGDTQVLFFHGEASPNFHPAIDPNETDRSRYPFPYLSNRVAIDKIAVRSGRGDVEQGRRTINYMRFAVGFWYGDGVQQTVLSKEQIQEFGADQPPRWGPRSIRTMVGADFSFTTGGDHNSLAFGQFSYENTPSPILALDPEAVHLYSAATDREGFRTDIARQAVAECRKRDVEPEDFFCDISNDGGLMLQAIQREWESHACVGLSSTEPPEDDNNYYNRVTEYWFGVANAVIAGAIRGFNVTSGYAKDLFARPFLSVGRGVLQVQPKKDFKKKIKRSPDDGDAVSYLVAGAIMRGLPTIRTGETPEETKERFDDVIYRRGLAQNKEEEDDTWESHEAGAESFDEALVD